MGLRASVICVEVLGLIIRMRNASLPWDAAIVAGLYAPLELEWKVDVKLLV
jgi:hypothetical protein